MSPPHTHTQPVVHYRWTRFEWRRSFKVGCVHLRSSTRTWHSRRRPIRVKGLTGDVPEELSSRAVRSSPVSFAAEGFPASGPSIAPYSFGRAGLEPEEILVGSIRLFHGPSSAIGGNLGAREIREMIQRSLDLRETVGSFVTKITKRELLERESSLSHFISVCLSTSRVAAQTPFAFRLLCLYTVPFDSLRRPRSRSGGSSRVQT